VGPGETARILGAAEEGQGRGGSFESTLGVPAGQLRISEKQVYLGPAFDGAEPASGEVGGPLDGGKGGPRRSLSEAEEPRPSACAQMLVGRKSPGEQAAGLPGIPRRLAPVSGVGHEVRAVGQHARKSARVSKPIRESPGPVEVGSSARRIPFLPRGPRAQQEGLDESPALPPCHRPGARVLGFTGSPGQPPRMESHLPAEQTEFDSRQIQAGESPFQMKLGLAKSAQADQGSDTRTFQADPEALPMIDPLEGLARPLECFGQPSEAQGDLGAQGEKSSRILPGNPASMGLGEAVRLGVAASGEQGAKGVEDRIAVSGRVKGEEHGVFGAFLR